MATEDELTQTVILAAKVLSPEKKADFLLQIAQDLIQEDRYGDDVERYLEVFLRTPGIDSEKVSKALMIRGCARRAAAIKLLTRANQDFQTVVKLDPSKQDFLKRDHNISLTPSPAYRRVPPEVWEIIASYIPRFHLRTWLSVSAFYRGIARRLIFRSVDLYFGEDTEHLSPGLDLLDCVKQDLQFAMLVKTLRIHWSYEDGDLLDVMQRMFRDALPAFKALREFEWIGYPEMRDDMVKALLCAHPRLLGIGLIGWHFDSEGVSGFRNLRKFTLRAEDDDGMADMSEVRTVLDRNEETLVHLTLGAHLIRHHSWDLAFESSTIQKLTHLDLVDTRISNDVLTHIAHAQNLRSLTLHGTFELPSAASVVFRSDHIVEGQHSFLPHLEAFRFIMIGHDGELPLFQSVQSFLRERPRLRRLDLGDCPWDVVKQTLPELTGLRVLRVKMRLLNRQAAIGFLTPLSSNMVAIHVTVITSDGPIDLYAQHFVRFRHLSILHLASESVQPPRRKGSRDHQFEFRCAVWESHARTVARTVPSLDFLGWHGEHYVVERHGDLGEVKLKELPARRRLDCGKGVDLGGEDASWLERTDVPIDYETSSGVEGST